MSDFAIMPFSEYKAACDAIRAATGSSELIKSCDLAAKISACAGGATKGVRVFATTPFYINDVLYEHDKSSVVNTYTFTDGEVLSIKDANNTLVTNIVAPMCGVIDVAIPSAYRKINDITSPVFDKELVQACINLNVHERCLPLGSQILLKDIYIREMTSDSYSTIEDWSIGKQSQIFEVEPTCQIWDNMIGLQKMKFRDNLYFIARGSELGTEGSSEFVLALLDELKTPTEDPNFLDKVIDSEDYAEYRICKKKGGWTTQYSEQYGIIFRNPTTGDADSAVTPSSCRVYKINLTTDTMYYLDQITEISDFSINKQNQELRMVEEDILWRKLPYTCQKNYKDNLYFISLGSNASALGKSAFAILLLDESEIEACIESAYDYTDYLQYLRDVVQTAGDNLVFRSYGGFSKSDQTNLGLRLYNTVTGNQDTAVSSNAARLYKLDMSASIHHPSLYATLVGHNIDKNVNNQIVPVTYIVDIPMTFSMNDTQTNIGGYAQTKFRQDTLSLLQSDILESQILSCLTPLRKSAWKTVNPDAAINPGDSSAYYETIIDILVPPSEVELLNSHQYAGGPASLNQEGHHYPYFDTTESLSLDFERFNSKRYWTRSTTNGKAWYDPEKGDQYYFVGFNGWSKSNYYGAATYNYLRLLFGFKPAVTLPSLYTMKVSGVFSEGRGTLPDNIAAGDIVELPITGVITDYVSADIKTVSGKSISYEVTQGATENDSLLIFTMPYEDTTLKLKSNTIYEYTIYESDANGSRGNIILEGSTTNVADIPKLEGELVDHEIWSGLDGGTIRGGGSEHLYKLPSGEYRLRLWLESYYAL